MRRAVALHCCAPGSFLPLPLPPRFLSLVQEEQTKPYGCPLKGSRSGWEVPVIHGGRSDSCLSTSESISPSGAIESTLSPCFPTVHSGPNLRLKGTRITGRTEGSGGPFTDHNLWTPSGLPPRISVTRGFGWWPLYSVCFFASLRKGGVPG